MDRVHDALVLAASVPVAPLEPPSDVRARGNRMARRQRALNAGVGVVVALAVGAGFLYFGDAEDRVVPAPPASSVRLPSADLPSSQPSPSVTPIGTPAAPVLGDGLCGHGRTCPAGIGSFLSHLEPASQRGSRTLVVRYVVPAGWSLRELAPGGLLVGEDDFRGPTVGVYWPLAPLEGAGDARAAASAMANLPGASGTPEKVTVSGSTAWRVTFAGDATAEAGASQTVAGSKCVVPRGGLYPGENVEGRCLQVAWTADGSNRTPVGVAGPTPIEVTFVDVPDSDADGNSAILGIWRAAVELGRDTAGQSIVDSIQVETTEG